VARAEAYPSAKFDLDQSNRLPQYTNVTDRQDRQTGQRSDSIRRTVLQTVDSPNNRVNLWLGEDVHTKHGDGLPPTFDIGCSLGVGGAGSLKVESI